jgi:hypothetical protein
LSFEVDPDSDDEEGKDFSEDYLSVHLEDHSLGQDYDSSSEVASGVFDASYTNTFEEPNSFKELLLNIAGPSVGSMIIFLDLLKDDQRRKKRVSQPKLTKFQRTSWPYWSRKQARNMGNKSST